MWVKICGIKDIPTAQWVAALSPDAIGINFFAGSPRYVTEYVATAIVDVLPANVAAVGVFVDQPIDEVIRICGKCGIPTAQLHGDYSLADVDACIDAGLGVIRIVRLNEEWPSDLTAELDQLSRQQQCDIRYLVDAHVPGTFGGTGKTAPWNLLRSRWQTGWPPLILAGGLTPDNVSEAIDAVHPFGVDVASGVESSPAGKDQSKVQAFIERAHQATFHHRPPTTDS